MRHKLERKGENLVKEKPSNQQQFKRHQARTNGALKKVEEPNGQRKKKTVSNRIRVRFARDSLQNKYTTEFPLLHKEGEGMTQEGEATAAKEHFNNKRKTKSKRTMYPHLAQKKKGRGLRTTIKRALN